MATAVTKGIRISVKTAFDPGHSDSGNGHFVFTYRVSIENQGEQTVQLRRRHWFIFDSCGEHHQVEGEGVVGAQPILRPGDIYEYESGCQLKSEMGKMHGNYLMERKSDGLLFKVEIPEFELVSVAKLN